MRRQNELAKVIYWIPPQKPPSPPLGVHRPSGNHVQLRNCPTTWTMRAIAKSTSASVVVAPTLNRIELATTSFGSPIARNVGESSVEPLEQAEPTDQATPAMSSAITRT